MKLPVSELAQISETPLSSPGELQVDVRQANSSSIPSGSGSRVTRRAGLKHCRWVRWGSSVPAGIWVGKPTLEEASRVNHAQMLERNRAAEERKTEMQSHTWRTGGVTTPVSTYYCIHMQLYCILDVMLINTVYVTKKDCVSLISAA